MKNKAIFLNLIFALCSAMLFAQPKSNITDSLGRKQGYWKKYVNDTLKYEGTFKDNKPQGEFKYYYPDKTVKSITNYSNSGVVAKTIMLYNNGKKNAEGTYIDKKKDGLWVYYNADQVKISQENYKNGLKEGEWRYYYDNSKINKIENYKNDLLDGLCFEFYADSLLKVKETYSKGIHQGLVQYFDLNGKVFLTGSYVNDLKEGEWMFFNGNGTGERKLTFKLGNLLKEEIIVTTKAGLKNINVKEIAFCERKDTTVYVRLNSGEQIQISNKIDDMDRLLGDFNFYRVNVNFIISMWSFKNRKTFKADNPVLTLNPDPGIPVVVEKELVEGFMSWTGLIKYNK
ncbi:MAG: LytTR family transcriptional regulator DNA-binding domain-containing protein [Bacteroidota bacterium]